MVERGKGQFERFLAGFALAYYRAHIIERRGTMTQMYGNKHQTKNEASEKPKKRPKLHFSSWQLTGYWRGRVERSGWRAAVGRTCKYLASVHG